MRLMQPLSLDVAQGDTPKVNVFVLRASSIAGDCSRLRSNSKLLMVRVGEAHREAPMLLIHLSMNFWFTRTASLTFLRTKKAGFCPPFSYRVYLVFQNS
jgi:hypothetical protein